MHKKDFFLLSPTIIKYYRQYFNLKKIIKYKLFGTVDQRLGTTNAPGITYGKFDCFTNIGQIIVK